eukprot:11150980-Alexandrium_andersonii.AAC.1
MSASLVGSEMCIRDRFTAHAQCAVFDFRMRDVGTEHITADIVAKDPVLTSTEVHDNITLHAVGNGRLSPAPPSFHCMEAFGMKYMINGT